MRAAEIAPCVLALLLDFAPADGGMPQDRFSAGEPIGALPLATSGAHRSGEPPPAVIRLTADDGFWRDVPREETDGFWRERPRPETSTDVLIA